VPTPTYQWPTLMRVETVVDTVTAAADALDEFSIETYHLINHDSPLELPLGVERPSAADVAAIAILCQRVEDEIGHQQRELEGLHALRDAVTYNAAELRETRA
jgi:hypothetical protein